MSGEQMLRLQSSQVFGGGIDLLGSNEGWGGRLRLNYGVAAGSLTGLNKTNPKNFNFALRPDEILKNTISGNGFAFAFEASAFATYLPMPTSDGEYVPTFGGGPRIVAGMPLGNVFTGLDVVGSLEDPLATQIYGGFRLACVEVTMSFDTASLSTTLTGTYGIGLHTGF